ncbi:DsbA family protein [Brevundimonas naejangsanensis]|uniref:DsbA family protein n=1 Tax=Brevundimonas naejangsanensis TaxID=588932 RepID=A0A494RJD9_9CAUL|nr:DsbA family protein [Brevundimonas naejangsanensis]AYG94034.1 DsbA family protein [Brevundimonas naejangsanensis]
MAPTSKYAAMSRRAALTAAALASMAVMAGCTAKTGGAAEGDMALGAAEGAKVTVVEYASVTCGHCAAWNEEVWPEFKTKYVDTKKVRYVFREFPTPPQDIAVAGFLIARCAGPDKYFDVVEDIMASQKEWLAGVAPRTTLFRAGQAAGLSEQQINDCIRDKSAIEAMEKRIKAGINAGVTGTPYFMVNGVKVADSSLSGLSEAIDAELAK